MPIMSEESPYLKLASYVVSHQGVISVVQHIFNCLINLTRTGHSFRFTATDKVQPREFSFFGAKLHLNVAFTQRRALTTGSRVETAFSFFHALDSA